MPPDYVHNSQHKEQVRARWLEFMGDMLLTKADQTNGLKIITFPAEAMQDLQLFSQKGFITLQKTETESYLVTKGDVVCFERREPVYRSLTKKLSRAKVYRDFGSFLNSGMKKLRQNDDVFPVDVVNLDYENNISKNEPPMDVQLRYIFELQSIHLRNFCLFLTWPIPTVPKDDEATFTSQLKSTIESNLEDANAKEFQSEFYKTYSSIDEMTYPKFSIVGFSKVILKESSKYGYQLERNEFYTYGDDGRRKMISVLYNFKSMTGKKVASTIYSEDVAKSLDAIRELIVE